MNNEISILKLKIKEAKDISNLQEDDDMLEKTQLVFNKLQKFSKETISESILLTVLASQSLVEEIYNGDND